MLKVEKSEIKIICLSSCHALEKVEITSWVSQFLEILNVKSSVNSIWLHAKCGTGLNVMFLVENNKIHVKWHV